MTDRDTLLDAGKAQGGTGIDDRPTDFDNARAAAPDHQIGSDPPIMPVDKTGAENPLNRQDILSRRGPTMAESGVQAYARKASSRRGQHFAAADQPSALDDARPRSRGACWGTLLFMP